MTRHPVRPSWRSSRVDVGRRHALLGLSGAVMAAVGARRVAAQGVGPGRCVLTPEAGEGPFYLDPDLVRSDIRAGQAGVPLAVRFQVVRDGDCATLADARVDVWHADALGLYSGYSEQSGVGGVSTAAAAGQQYLRGTQLTDADGRVRFRTIYPSWYGGRTPHVHFKVFLGGNEVVASQIFFPDEINEAVFTTADPYRAHVSKRTAFNHNDPFPDGVTADVRRDGDGYVAGAVLVVASR